jgi:hypothetical protein
MLHWCDLSPFWFIFPNGSAGTGRIDLSHLNALRQLRIRENYMLMAASTVAVLNNLGSASVRPLETIELFVDIIEQMNCTWLAEWRAIDTKLAESALAWPDLRRLVICAHLYRGHGGKAIAFPDEAYRILRHNMPWCQAREILVIL